MSFFDHFRSSKKNTANIARERLQIIVAHERGQRHQPDYMQKMQEEILAVIRKYVQIDDDNVHVQLDKSDHCSVLELNVTLPDNR